MSVCMSVREHVCINVHLHSTCIHMCIYMYGLGTDNFLENVLLLLLLLCNIVQRELRTV